MLVKRAKAEPNPVQRTILMKEKLIERLRREIASERAECEEHVKRIEFRIKMVQTLVDALKKSKSA